jgi:hypothetical protein
MEWQQTSEDQVMSSFPALKKRINNGEIAG